MCSQHNRDDSTGLRDRVNILTRHMGSSSRSSLFSKFIQNIATTVSKTPFLWYYTVCGTLPEPRAVTVPTTIYKYTNGE